jgi:hypothetical protein
MWVLWPVPTCVIAGRRICPETTLRATPHFLPHIICSGSPLRFVHATRARVRVRLLCVFARARRVLHRRETSESLTYPFEKQCDSKLPLTMKADTFYAKVVSMLEVVKHQTNEYLTHHLAEAAKAQAESSAAVGGGGRAASTSDGAGAPADGGDSDGAELLSEEGDEQELEEEQQVEEGPPEDKRARLSDE